MMKRPPDGRRVKAVTAHAGLDIAIREVTRTASPRLAAGTHPFQVPVGCCSGEFYIRGVEPKLLQPPWHKLAVAIVERPQIGRTEPNVLRDAIKLARRACLQF